MQPRAAGRRRFAAPPPAVGGQVVQNAAEVALRVGGDPGPIARKPLKRGLQQILGAFPSAGQRHRGPHQLVAALSDQAFQAGAPQVFGHHHPPVAGQRNLASQGRPSPGQGSVELAASVHRVSGSPPHAAGWARPKVHRASSGAALPGSVMPISAISRPGPARRPAPRPGPRQRRRPAPAHRPVRDQRRRGHPVLRPGRSPRSGNQPGGIGQPARSGADTGPRHNTPRPSRPGQQGEYTMRIAVISDVHANPPALRAVLADINAAAPDAVVSCGDLAAGPLPHPAIDLLRGLDIPVHCVRGNADRAMIETFDGTADPAGILTAWASTTWTPRSPACANLLWSAATPTCSRTVRPAAAGWSTPTASGCPTGSQAPTGHCSARVSRSAAPATTCRPPPVTSGELAAGPKPSRSPHKTSCNHRRPTTRWPTSSSSKTAPPHSHRSASQGR